MTGRRDLTDEENHAGHIVRGLIRDGVVGREFLRQQPEASYYDIMMHFYPALYALAYPPECVTLRARNDRAAFRHVLSILDEIINTHPAPGFMLTPEARSE